MPGYSLAICLAVAAQLARLPLDPPTLIPFITYVPFMVLAAAVGGFGPGLLATGICLLEAMHFAVNAAALGAVDPHDWYGLGVLVLTGMVASALFHSLRRAQRSYAAAADDAAGLTRRLEARKLMLETIFENSPAAIALLRGPEFTFALVNPAYQALLPGEAMLGRTIADVWPHAAPIVLPLLNVVRDARTVYHADGLAIPIARGPESPMEELSFDVSYVPLDTTNDERDVDVLVVAVETTEQKRAEAGLRAAYSQLEAIHARAPVALFVIDEQFCVRELNELAARFAGRGIHTMVGLPVGEALDCLNALSNASGCGAGPTCGQCSLRRAIEDTLSNGISHEGIEAWMDIGVSTGGVSTGGVSTGSPRRCLLTSTTALEGNGGRMALVCAQDITERKQAEVELARQRDELARLAELLNLSHDAIITADAQRVIRSWNRGAEEMYGWTAAEAVGQKTHTLLHTSNCHPIDEIDITLANENQWAGELEHSRRDKRRILVESRQVRIPAAEGTDVRILEINRDITQRHSDENELRSNTQEMAAALAEKTVLLQEIHHRVKNNLAVTASLLSMKAEESGPEARAALLESQQRVHSIAMVHEHLYDHARLDRINFGDYARGLAHGVYSTFGGRERGIALDLELDSLEMSIERAVPCALILNELLSNAFKYAFDGRPAGRIQVCFRRTEPDVCELAVEDDGVGLAPDALGGGKQSLGLRIVRILTAQLDGSVERSDRPGTRIVLRFPAGGIPKARAAMPPSASLPSSTANRPSPGHSKPRSPR